MNQGIRLRPASPASPVSPAGSQMIPGWFLDDKGIRIEPGPFQQTPGGTNEAKDITKTIEIIVSFGWMYGIREIQKSWNTYKYCYFYDFCCCFQKKHMFFPKQSLLYGVLADFNLVPAILKSWPWEPPPRRIPGPRDEKKWFSQTFCRQRLGRATFP